MTRRRVAPASADTLVGVRLTVVLGRLLVLEDARLGLLDAAPIWRAVREGTGDLRPGVHRVRVRQGLYMAIRAYLSRHLPGPAWDFAGAEVPAGGGRADLVWTSREGAGLLVDEVKLVLPAGPLGDALGRQLGRYARHYADDRSRVELRVISLAHPERSRTLRAEDPALAAGGRAAS